MPILIARAKKHFLIWTVFSKHLHNEWLTQNPRKHCLNHQEFKNRQHCQLGTLSYSSDGRFQYYCGSIKIKACNQIILLTFLASIGYNCLQTDIIVLMDIACCAMHLTMFYTHLLQTWYWIQSICLLKLRACGSFMYVHLHFLNDSGGEKKKSCLLPASCLITRMCICKMDNN